MGGRLARVNALEEFSAGSCSRLVQRVLDDPSSGNPTKSDGFVLDGPCRLQIAEVSVSPVEPESARTRVWPTVDDVVASITVDGQAWTSGLQWGLDAPDAVDGDQLLVTLGSLGTGRWRRAFVVDVSESCEIEVQFRWRSEATVPRWTRSVAGICFVWEPK